MPFFVESLEYGHLAVDAAAIRRLSSPGSGQLTVITADDGSTITVEDYPRRIITDAGIGESGPFIPFSIASDDSGAEWIHGDWIAMMSKVLDQADDDDPTRLTLVDGNTVDVGESIRTISARLRSRGFQAIDIDIPTTERPASVMPRAILAVDSNGDEGTIRLKGGVTVTVRDPYIVAMQWKGTDGEPEPETVRSWPFPK